MYVTVKLLCGCPKPLTYAVPEELRSHIGVGSLVHVPLRQQKTYALVEELEQTLAVLPPFAIREILSPVRALQPTYQHFVEQLATYQCVHPVTLYKRIQRFFEEKPEQRMRASVLRQVTQRGTITLSDEQNIALKRILPSVTTRTYHPFLLQGVTGSGKTEIYRVSIQTAWKEGRTTLFLVPEVTLALSFFERLRTLLDPEIPIFCFHSASSSVEKRKTWDAVEKNIPCLIVGVHLPILLPVQNLGLCIVDEEHEPGYHEKAFPHINSKEAACLRAKIEGIPLILGSATPSIQTLHLVERGIYTRVRLTQRFQGAFPTITHVRLLTDEKKRPHRWISKELNDALAENLQRGEQSLIFMNRRGHSFFTQCADCGHIFTCTACSVSLTVHRDSLKCHYCNAQSEIPIACSQCNKKKLLRKGIGTQQLVDILQELYPTARIARGDLDSVSKKKEWPQTLELMEKGELDILVGTQTITKGYHFPKVSLVGVIWADVNLSIPRYTATETTVQQLIQVAGRAGRVLEKSRVIIQSINDHAAFAYINEERYDEFYEYEKGYRSQLRYPPFVRFAQLSLQSTCERTLEKEADQCAAQLEEYGPSLTVMGPVVPPVHTIEHVHSRILYLKAERYDTILAALKTLAQLNLSSTLSYTPNPLF